MLQSYVDSLYKGNIAMLRNFTEKRRKQPSLVIPILFFLLELIMMFLIASLFNWSLEITTWHGFTYPVLIIWILLSLLKLSIVLKRQKMKYD